MIRRIAIISLFAAAAYVTAGCHSNTETRTYGPCTVKGINNGGVHESNLYAATDRISSYAACGIVGVNYEFCRGSAHILRGWQYDQGQGAVVYNDPANSNETLYASFHNIGHSGTGQAGDITWTLLTGC